MSMFLKGEFCIHFYQLDFYIKSGSCSLSVNAYFAVGIAKQTFCPPLAGSQS